MRPLILAAVAALLCVGAARAAELQPPSSGARIVAVGNHAMSDYIGDGHNLIAIGDYTQIPNGMSDYINIGNQVCLHNGLTVICPENPGDPEWLRKALPKQPYQPTPRMVMGLLERIGVYFQHETDPAAAPILTQVGDDLINGKHSLALGYCAGPPRGTPWPTHGNILIGAGTAAPDWHVNNFVNIGNTICFWRDTLKVAKCPPPQKCD